MSSDVLLNDKASVKVNEDQRHYSVSNQTIAFPSMPSGTPGDQILTDAKDDDIVFM